MSKRIAYLVQGMDTGGLERVVYLLSREMVRRGHEVFICCYDQLGAMQAEAEAAGARVVLVPRKPGVHLAYIGILARWLREIRPDVLHAHNETALFYGTLAGRRARVPTLLYTEHDGAFPRRWIVRFVNRRLVRRLRQAVAVSEAVKALWCREDGVRPEDVIVIPNGVPDPQAEHRAGRRSRRPGACIGSVGRLSTEKGVDVLIRALPPVLAAVPEAELVIVGDGPERAKLETLASELRVNDRVRFLGRRSDVWDQLAGFDVFALPSRSEGMPMALLEAMAMELPTVSTSVGGIPEVVVDRVNGLLVPPQNPEALAAGLVRTLRDRALAERLARAARQTFTERYELSKMVDAYERCMMQ
jgi:glycosyltransferase involved in cell wall biosynthesis